ncbi:MAG: thiamine pyrophosphate-dependent enzyme [Candidatus Pacearchaeota archaeon]|nr:thiamine pyrophosphate-dependent enzyme [Candidatus Pacearchaeota archaeon]
MVLIDEKKFLDIYRKMDYTRKFENQVMSAVDKGEIKCPVYLSIGQEAISSTLSVFYKPDLIFTQHRGHSVYLAYGGDIGKLIDELLGKDSGCNRGRGGSPGIQDLGIGMIGHHGLIGENVPIAVGAALGDPSKKVLCVFGDGAAEEDYVFTAMGFAVTHKLPVFFVCEDNNLSILTKKSERRSWELTDATKAIGMPSANIPDDPFVIAEYVKEFRNNLPAFLNCRTCRHRWHTGTGEDGKPEKDRLEIFREELIKNGLEHKIYRTEQLNGVEVEKLWKEHLQKQ